MTMQQMVEAFKKKGFDVEKVYNNDGRYYRFIIEKYAVEVAGNFQYPAGKDFNLKDRLQRDFIDKLLDKWQQAANEKRWCYDCKHYYKSHMCGYDASMCSVHGSLDVDQKERHPDTTADTCPYYCPNGKGRWYEKYENKKGESNMKDNDNLMYALAQTTAGHLEIMGKKYPVMVRDVTSTSGPDRYAAPETLLTCELMSSSAAYAAYDTLMTGLLAKTHRKPTYSYGRDLPKIKDVIFNPPATIVFWADNTKTVVKCQEGDDYDPEKGLTMAITKKIFGNKGNYCEEIKKWVKKYQPEPVELRMDVKTFNESIKDALEKLGIKTIKEEPVEVCMGPIVITEATGTEEPEKRWKIWWKRYNPVDGKVIGSGVHCVDYVTKSSAITAAENMFSGTNHWVWTVSQDNPWEKD